MNLTSEATKMAVQTSSEITLNLLQGAVRFRFAPDAAAKLQAALQELVGQLKAIAAQPLGHSPGATFPPLEYQYTGEVFLEVFCNPNIWPTPYAAKLLITVRDDRIRLTTEAELPRILEDLGQYLEAG